MPVMYWAVLRAAENTLDVMSQVNSYIDSITETVARITCPDGVMTDDTWEKLYNLGWAGPHEACFTPFGIGYRVEPTAFATLFLSVDLKERSGSYDHETHKVLLRAMRFDGEYVTLHSMVSVHMPTFAPHDERLARMDNFVRNNGWLFSAPWIFAGWRRDGEYEISTYERVVQRDPAAIADIKGAISPRSLW